MQLHEEPRVQPQVQLHEEPQEPQEPQEVQGSQQDSKLQVLQHVQQQDVGRDGKYSGHQSGSHFEFGY